MSIYISEKASIDSDEDGKPRMTVPTITVHIYTHIHAREALHTHMDLCPKSGIIFPEVTFKHL